MSTRLVVGLPLYGAGEHLEEAIESLLSQSFRDLAIVITDDRPNDESTAILARFSDPRLTYRANAQRLGLVGNWVRSFAVARKEYPEASYFAWGSDHDAWHPFWAERLIAALDAAPQTVVCYPSTYRMTAGGSTLLTQEYTCSTVAKASAASRVGEAVKRMSAGNMVYGMYRCDALERVGVMRMVLLPDRLLLTELSVLGHLHQVPERLFYRRVLERPSTERQRAAFWPAGPPLYARLPWAWQHIGVMSWTLLVKRSRASDLSLGDRARIVGCHTAATMQHVCRRSAIRAYAKIMGGHSTRQFPALLVDRAVRSLQGRRRGELVLAIGRRGAGALTRRW